MTGPNAMGDKPLKPVVPQSIQMSVVTKTGIAMEKALTEKGELWTHFHVPAFQAMRSSTLVHREWPNLSSVLAILSATWFFTKTTFPIYHHNHHIQYLLLHRQ